MVKTFAFSYFVLTEATSGEKIQTASHIIEFNCYCQVNTARFLIRCFESNHSFYKLADFIFAFRFEESKNRTFLLISHKNSHIVLVLFNRFAFESQENFQNFEVSSLPERRNRLLICQSGDQFYCFLHVLSQEFLVV